MDEDRVCALCGELLSEDDEGHFLKDGRLVCEDCLEYNCGCCDNCGEYVEEDELEYFGDDYRLCPDCFEEEFPPFDEAKNNAETQNAYDAMKKRLIGKKTDAEGPREYDIETDMDMDSYRRGISVSIDEDGRICDVSRLSVMRCRAIWIKGEDWRDIPVDAEDYAEDGLAEDLIRSEIGIMDEEDADDEEV